jgi:alkylation response protein AidB-like acyl-CoA dehydrogenase
MWWDPKVEEYRAEIRAFAEEVVAPAADRMDESGEFEPQLLAALRERDLVSLLCPTEFGGRGFDTLTYAVAVEELSRICGSTGITVAAANSLGVYPVATFGSPEQRARVLPGVAADGHMIAFGLTEPDAGSDAAGTKTTAVREGDGWVLNGSKCFITNGHLAEWIIATAVTAPGIGARGISSFLFHKDTPGFSAGRKEKKLGLCGSDTTTLHFDGLRLPLDAMLGPENQGFKQFMTTLDGGRISIGAMALGLAQGSYEIAVRYAKTRRQFGRPIADMQAIQFKLADMGTRIEAARHLIYHAAYLKDGGKPYGKQSAMAKLYASEVGSFCAYQSIQVLGGAGYMSENRVERHYRDVKLCEIGEGTSEIQRIVIARQILREFEAATLPEVSVDEARKTPAGA